MRLVDAGDVRAGVEACASSPRALLERMLQLCATDKATLVSVFTESVDVEPSVDDPGAAGATSSTPTRASSTQAGRKAIALQRIELVESLRQMRRTASVVLIAGKWPAPGELLALTEDLLFRYRQAAPILVARALAEALDEQWSDLIRVEFTMREDSELLQGHMVPIPVFDLRDAYDKAFGHPVSLVARPEHLFSAAYHVDRTTHFRLCQVPTGMTVTAV